MVKNNNEVLMLSRVHEHVSSCLVLQSNLIKYSPFDCKWYTCIVTIQSEKAVTHRNLKGDYSIGDDCLNWLSLCWKKKTTSDELFFTCTDFTLKLFLPQQQLQFMPG